MVGLGLTLFHFARNVHKMKALPLTEPGSSGVAVEGLVAG